MNGSSRSIAIKKNIIASLFLKGISILVSLQVVPLTINYINPTRYGIWLTLSSIVAWLSYFDLGFAHGFRNRFAEAVAKGDMQLAREYVSTTYVVLSLLFSSVFLIAIVVNHFVDWSAILNVDAAYSSELNIVFGILAFFFCLNIVASIFTTTFPAEEREDIIDWCIELGLPVTLKELGITEVTDEKLMAVATAACAENDTLHNMPFEVTPETVCAAIKAADAYGRYFLGE